MDRTEARGNPPNKFAIYAPEEQQLHVESHSDQQRQSSHLIADFIQSATRVSAKQTRLRAQLKPGQNRNYSQKPNANLKSTSWRSEDRWSGVNQTEAANKKC